MTYFGWYDADKKRTAAQKLEAACDRYREKFSAEPTVVLCNPHDAQNLPQPPLGVMIEGRHYIALNTFYVGQD
jgi:hypothetical protein